MNFTNTILFGGTFDPIHRGHIETARVVAAQRKARVVLLPTARNPLKRPPVATDAQRLAMLERATADEPAISVCDFELRRAGSYTIETIESFLAGGSSELMWLVGADNLRDLPRWRRVEDLLTKVQLLVACRPPSGLAQARASVDALEGQLPPALVQKVREGLLQTPPFDISSTEIRAGIAAGNDCRTHLPADVWAYINEENLYKPV